MPIPKTVVDSRIVKRISNTKTLTNNDLDELGAYQALAETCPGLARQKARIEAERDRRESERGGRDLRAETLADTDDDDNGYIPARLPNNDSLDHL